MSKPSFDAKNIVVKLFNGAGGVMAEVEIPHGINPRAIVVGERVFILEVGRYVLVESFRL